MIRIARRRIAARVRAVYAAAGISVLLLMTTAAVAEYLREPYFAEPGTGRKVSTYTITLPLDGGEEIQLSIPAECPTALQMIAEGRPGNANALQRRIWFKVDSDCRYFAFLSRFRHPVAEDHVSGYDFRNARIDDLPIDPRCRADVDPAQDGACNPAETDRAGRLRFFPLGQPLTDPEQATCNSCSLRNGLFRGPLLVAADGRLRCQKGRPRPTLRLLTVDYADVNGDQVMDAVLRFVSLERGAARKPMMLALTRHDGQGEFVVPE